MILLTIQFLLCLADTKAYSNLALHKPAKQAHNWPDAGKDEDWGASKAVDGQYSDRSAGGNQCTISGPDQKTAEWGVDLQRVVSISHINIYYRTANKPSPGAFYDRFAGFFLYVSNTTSKNDGHLCFHELQNVNGTPIENQTIDCPVQGQHVIYYNERRSEVTYPAYYSKHAFNELCELEVYGCSDPTFYGEKCDQKCPENCQERRCNITTGHCLGCIPGYQGPSCDRECNKQTFGPECSLSCGNCSEGETCHHVNGTCINGCNEGSEGEMCLKACDPGFYGKDCANECSDNCAVRRRCDRFTGECEGGCQPGWIAPRCDKECADGMYGYNCNTSCGNCFKDSQCHHVNGSCLEGCSAGYEGWLCINECPDVKWGVNCKMNCSTNCVNQTCHHVSGDCSPSTEPLKETMDAFPTLPVVSGVIAFVVLLTVIIAVILLRRIRGKGNKQQKIKRKSNKAITKNPPKDFKNIYENTECIGQSNEKKSTRNISRSGMQESKSSKIEVEDEIDNDEKVHEENPYGDFYINEEAIEDINIDHLEHTIKEKRKNEDDGFKREYAALPYGEMYPCNAGKQPENIPKNRFKTTFPYDHSRIKLSNSQSDYINANFIDGTIDGNEYIASQGPRQKTVTDFWSMIWQENVHQIVMLTNLKEGNKTKCVKYWSDLHQDITFGGFSLRMEEDRSYANYNIRKVRVTYERLNTSRIVTQYHYTAWPDHGVPEPLCLVVFHDHVTRTKEEGNTGPLLVHCSAGIGRTGTYIAIDALYKAGKANRNVNIAEYVKKMRDNRMNMVQTYEQYMTIFLALDVMFKAPTCVHTKPEFLRKAELMTRDKPANESEIRKEFQNLLRVRPSYTEVDYKIAFQSGDSNSSVLPLDKYSVFLSSSVPKRGNYINAVTLSSYTNQNAFIITHHPSPVDAVDFLRLLTDHESDVVISMDPLNDIESRKAWLPAINTSKVVSPYTVHCEHQLVTEIKCSTIRITQRMGNGEGCSVSIIEPKESLKIKDHSTAAAGMLCLVSFALQKETEGPITIVSSDGAVLCGVFCAVYNTLQQLSMDGEVDIFSTVRQFQIRRPKLCSSMDEYRMVYDVVLDYIRTQGNTSEENVYYN